MVPGIESSLKLIGRLLLQIKVSPSSHSYCALKIDTREIGPQVLAFSYSNFSRGMQQHSFMTAKHVHMHAHAEHTMFSPTTYLSIHLTYRQPPVCSCEDPNTMAIPDRTIHILKM